MLAAERAETTIATPGSFCWGCGVANPGDPCWSCGGVPAPRAVAPDELVGAAASVRQRMRLRSGLIVAETPTTVFLALSDASVEEVLRGKLADVRPVEKRGRSSAWTLVGASRSTHTSNRQGLDELVTSFVIRLIDRSVDHARAFALDALDADCPGWLNKVKLSTAERDFLFASYQADRGNSAAALERLLQLPVDRYPCKDLVFLRCIEALQGDEKMRGAVREHLAPFPDRPVGQALLALLGDGSLSEGTWIAASRYVLTAAGNTEEASFPRPVASDFYDALEGDAALPADAAGLAPEVKRLELVGAIRSGTEVPQITLADLAGAPEALIDDAVEHGALRVPSVDRDHPSATYVLARLDPDALNHDELVALEHQTELARRAFLRGDRATMDALPATPASQRFKTLVDLQHGAYERALELLDVFEEPSRAKVESLARCIAEGSIEHASDEVLTDGTTWPLLAPLLPEDAGSLSELGTGRPALRGVAAWRGLSSAVSSLWAWDWETAIAEAKRCLMVARDEQTRDEALNIIACAHWHLGDDTDAVAALTHALDGEYTEGLQVNVGVVAATLEPQLAGEHLGKLAMQAPTLALRVSAAERALAVWFADPDPWDDQEDEKSLPVHLRDGLRTLVKADIDEASFARFARTMSRWDEGWFADPHNLAGSLHGASVVADVYQAKARDFGEFVRTLASVVGGDDAPEWATTERDSLVGAAIASLDPSDANPMAASFGLALLDNGLPVDAEELIDLVGFTVVAICAGIDSSEAEPQERFLDMLEAARTRLGEVKAEEQERSGKLLDFAVMRVAGSIAAARAHQYDQVIDVYNKILFQVRGVPRHQVNRSALRDATEPPVSFLEDTARILDRLTGLVPEAGFNQNLTEFRDEVRQLRQAFRQLRGE